MTSPLSTKWNTFLEVVQSYLPREGEDYQKWFAPIMPIAWENNILTIRVPSSDVYKTIEQTYLDVLSNGLVKAFGRDIQLKYQVPSLEQKRLSASRKRSTQEEDNDAPVFQTHLDSRLSLDAFLPSDCNRLAYAAAGEIIREPGKSAFNPLFVHGASGVGKTHLMHAIGNQIMSDNPDARVVYVPTQTFKRQFVTATIVDKNTDHFFGYYQNIDVLLLDDVQELSEAVATQNAFFQIFNHLKLLGKQIIITSDRPPVELKGMEDRLFTRLRWGLTVEINRPDVQLRKQILTKKVEEAGIKLPKDVFDFIVKHTPDNVRDIEGSLTSLMAHSLFSNRPLNLDLAKKVMTQTVGLEEKEVTVSDIIKAVTDFYNVSAEDLASRKRTRIVTTARQLVMYLSKKYTDTPLKVIGTSLGKRDHSTVIYGIKNIEDLLSIDLKLQKDVSKITERLGF